MKTKPKKRKPKRKTTARVKGWGLFIGGQQPSFTLAESTAIWWRHDYGPSVVRPVSITWEE
jgi:hypothetical protein